MLFEVNKIKQSVKRHLSAIGKRLSDKAGNNVFSNITVSTAEDALLEQYINAATQNIETVLRQLVVTYTPANMTGASTSGPTIEISLINKRNTTDFDARCTELASTYIILFVIAEYLAMTHPDIAAKYVTDYSQSMLALSAFAFYKEPPDVTSMGNPSGSFQQ